MKRLIIILCSLLLMGAGGPEKFNSGPTLRNIVVGTGAVHWMDASDASKVTITGSGVSQVDPAFGSIPHTQGTDANRPLYTDAGGRQNLFLNSEALDGWVVYDTGGGGTDGVVTANAIAAPDGTTTAERYQAEAGRGVGWDHFTEDQDAYALVQNVEYQFSIFMKEGETHDCGYIRTKFDAGTVHAAAQYPVIFIDLSDGSIAATSAAWDSYITSHSISDAGNGWARITFNVTATVGSGNMDFGVGIASTAVSCASGTANFETNQEDLYYWGMQVSETHRISSPGYVKTTSTAVQPGINGRHTIYFDGSNDILSSSGTLATAAEPLTVIGVIRTVNLVSGKDWIAAPGASQTRGEITNSANKDIAWANVTDNAAPDYIHSGNDVTEAGEVSIWSMVSTMTSGELFYNGVLAASVPTYIGSRVAFDNINLGCFNVTTNLWNGDIGELIIWNKAIHQSTRVQIERLLAKKWGANLR